MPQYLPFRDSTLTQTRPGGIVQGMNPTASQPPSCCPLCEQVTCVDITEADLTSFADRIRSLTGWTNFCPVCHGITASKITDVSLKAFAERIRQMIESKMPNDKTVQARKILDYLLTMSTPDIRPWREVLATGTTTNDINVTGRLYEHGNDPAEDASYTNCTKCHHCIAYEPSARDAEEQLAQIRNIVSRLFQTSEPDPVDTTIQHVERSILKELADALVLMGVE